MTEAASFLLSQHDDFNCFFCKAFKHGVSPYFAAFWLKLILAQP
jgi:hypothetical protein